MTLSTRSEPYIIPSYSLTGDLLSYLQCGRQYRYQNRGALPPSKPVQLWFGQFIHGVLEEAYRRWRTQHDDWIEGNGMGSLLNFPWSSLDIEDIQNSVIKRLAAQGIIYRNRAMLDLARKRADESINTIGLHLFPLIDQAEVRLQGNRKMPLSPGTARSDYYEISGVVDVLTSFQLVSANASNRILQALMADSGVKSTLTAARAQSKKQFEIIVDYKGMRLPSRNPNNNTLEHYEWQIQTYAWLRNKQANSHPVLAGILLFINELVPSFGDLEDLYKEVIVHKGANTTLLPTGLDLQALQNWNPNKRGSKPPTLSLEYRLARTIHIVPINQTTVGNSVQQFDGVVAEIETSIRKESKGSNISNSWRSVHNSRSCTVCDFKSFCDTSGEQGTPYAP
ncbi:MAG: PD-(D/E)XK nuclease family protein [Chloroflexi bacterium]|nr:PD-(D/E)XK nuclease family protein [Chloroflexota bacterium]